MLPFLNDKIKAGFISGSVPEVVVSENGETEATEAPKPISEQPIMGTSFNTILRTIILRYLSRG